MKSIWNKFYKTFASVRTGILLLLTVVLFAAVGTVILQRPTSEPLDIQQAYSPTTLMWLDKLQLTDIYHAWYFVALLGLVSLSIIFVSIERWPNAWRYYSRPYRRTESHFRASLPNKVLIPVSDPATALDAAERGFKKQGLPVEREVAENEVSLYSEKHRISEFAVYLVHASLMFIFIGGMLDGLIGYRGMMQLNKGELSNAIQLRAGTQLGKPRLIPFQIRCDDVGMESYPDGSPKKYWSNLAIVQKGQEVQKKQIVVNDPLTYRGVRIFQASMGQSNQLNKAVLIALLPGDQGQKGFDIGLKQTVDLSDGYKVRMDRFVPDYYVMDNAVYTKSEFPDNPAFQLTLIDKDGKESSMWLVPRQANVTPEGTPIRFAAKTLKMTPYTGLEVSYQPGQWGVWIGVVLMALGLGVVFYMSHTRYWAVVVDDAKLGKALWVGGTTNRNKFRFETDFKQLVEMIRGELPQGSKTPAKIENNELAKV